MTDPTVILHITENLKAHKFGSYVLENYKKDGVHYTAEVSIHPVFNHEGKCTHFVGLHKDVSLSVREAERTRNNERLLTATSELAKVGGWKYDVASNSLYWTEGIFMIYGLPRGKAPTLAEALGCYPDPGRSQLRQLFENCQSEGTPFTVELPFINFQDEHLYVRASARAIEEDGVITQVIGAFQDISETHDMRQQNQNFLSVAEELVCVWDDDGNLLFTNDKCSSLIGLPAEKLYGCHYSDFIIESDRVNVASAVRVLYETGRMSDLYTQLVNFDNETKIVAWNAVRDPDTGNCFAIGRDVTGQRAQERALMKALERANSANEAKRQFLMTLSHELRTPLNPVTSYSDLLLDIHEDEDSQFMLKEIRNSAQNLQRQINDLLDYARLDADALEKYVNDFDLLVFFDGLYHSYAPHFKAKGLSLTKELVGDLNPNHSFKVTGDLSKLRQVAFNLLSNACKFTQTGGAVIKLEELYQEDLPQNQRFYCLSVIDTGIGIAEKDQKLIYEPFTQVDNTQTRKYDGAGIGLSLCRKIADMLGGSLEVISTPGQGSCFEFTFMLTISKQALAEEEDALLTQTREPVVTKAPNILVVEDDPGNRAFFGVCLKQQGLHVSFAHDGPAGVKAALKHTFDTVLMDIRMPGMDGYEATERIRATSGLNRSTPIIGITTDTSETGRRRAASSGMNDLLQKPVRPVDLFRTLDKWTLKNETSEVH